jgi:DNA-binding response OmpR family regulator
MAKIALIEDDPDLFELIEHNLRAQGHDVVGQRTGAGALAFLKRVHPDLVVLDVLLPDGDGIEICRQVRADSQLARTPVIFLTALGSETDRVIGLEIGGNDYVVKPFSVRELVARVKIHLRTQAPDADILRAGPLELNGSQFTVSMHGQPVALTATEFRLLEHLMRHPGQVFRRERLLDAVWGDRRDVLERTVDAYIVRLRNKLEKDPSKPRWIRSRRGVGYTFQTGEE